MFERFTERARRAVVVAQEQSMELGHQEIDLGHLVLALLANAADELAAVEHPVDLEPVRAAMLDQLGPRVAKRGPIGHIPFTAAARTALEQGQRIALLDRRNYIDDYDLLLGALQDPTLRTALSAAGVDREGLRSAVLEAQQRRPREEGAGSGRGRMTSRPAPFAPTATPTPTTGAPAPSAGGPVTGDRSAEIVDLLGRMLARLDTIIERLDERGT